MCLDESDCFRVLRAKLGTDSFKVLNHALEPFENPKGFQSKQWSLKITATFPEKKTFNFFVKSCDSESMLYKRYLNHVRPFFKEHVFMTGIVNDLQASLEEKITGECYYAKINEVLVFEDLCESGYTLIDEIDFAHAEAIAKAFARLHGAAIIYEEKTGVSLMDKYKSINFESLFIVKPQLETLVGSNYQQIKDMLMQHYKNLDQQVVEKVVSNAYETLAEMVKPSKLYRNVVCHGDPWGNNILFRKNENALSAILVDFQTVRFCPPAQDIVHFLSVGTTKEFRLRYGNDFKKTYYQQLKHVVESKGVDFSAILPEHVFYESLNHYDKFGLVLAPIYATVPQLPPEYLKEYSQDEEKFMNLLLAGESSPLHKAFLQNSIYRKRFDGSLSELCEHFTKKQL